MLEEIKDLTNEIIEMAESGHLNPELALASIKEIAENIKENVRIMEYEEWKIAESEYEHR